MSCQVKRNLQVFSLTDKKIESLVCEAISVALPLQFKKRKGEIQENFGGSVGCFLGNGDEFVKIFPPPYIPVEIMQSHLKFVSESKASLFLSQTNCHHSHHHH